MPHLISATLTNKAYEVYCKWKSKREASAKISLAMCELDSIQELNAALSTQLNIYKARWKWLNQKLQREMDLKENNADRILEFACQDDHLYYRRD
jgi:hypothetical protein